MTTMEELARFDPDRLRRPAFADDVFIASTATVIGNVEIGSGSGVWFGAVIRADVMPVRIGSETSIQDNCVLHSDSPHFMEVGDRVTVGHGCVLHGCRVEDDAMVGMKATLLNGSRVGRGALVAAGALVREGQEIPARALAVGVPAKVIGEVNDATASAMRQNARVYVELARRYREAGFSNPAHFRR